MSHWQNVFVTVFVSAFWQDVAKEHSMGEEAGLWNSGLAWASPSEQVTQLFYIHFLKAQEGSYTLSKAAGDYVAFPNGHTWPMPTRHWPLSEKYKLPAGKNCSLLWNDSLEWQAWYPKCVWGLAWICAEVTWGRERNLPYTGNSALPSEGPGPTWRKFISPVLGLVTHFSADERQCSA